ncbi:MAG: DUF3298 and DUF4163 domain-containing protein [Clostridium sp.]|jgi:hypothetical protein|uniref:DUF3298 and DUF4163 domain-containing protein n=1 Tax=Clostridium sp. TaxID=1506 RepID=UPI0025BF8D54|nr:DUF3298 and DUF4163 domain-containing protein [Clostridium sp.]MCH3963671.1 DUF3298 and DUF4163 domain-containing protein [Clostridium sp.]MCI1714812.1 DUF3298 and DUF4163 domain-containing protein [Clostridium sp.]MCI1798999.1 DUF3298 and DUF4163 domain-containing protein [Clostridium sp.]MCI1812995.1 DUF3298 and DUF4163 domain-containing protein [Clostridium sp.]MCI1869885.1 DUF3298 and DUF4163 domain-containing protein [Clostridium sp.]
MLYFSYPDNLSELFDAEDFYLKYSRNDNKDVPVNLSEQKLMPEEFSISYPVIENASNGENISKINEAIIDQVSRLFKSQVLVDGVTDFNQVLGTYEVRLNKSNLLSILFAMYTYVNRAAHGFTKYSSLTIDAKTGHIYSFNELFNQSTDYAAVLNEIAYRYIKDNNITLINEYNGITKDQEYYLTPDSLVIYYQVYEYTPYSYGLFKIEIPYDKIKDIINPSGPIARLI